MSAESYDLIEGIATAEEYVQIREVCELGNRSLAATRKGLAGTWFGVIARREAKTVVMAWQL